MINSEFRTATKIAGVTFENENGISIQSILPKLKKGDGLFFIRDYHNAYDENAIKVYCKEGHIGHLNKDLAAEIAPFLSENDDFDLEGAVLEVTGGDDKTYGCNIRIWVYDRSELDFEDIESHSPKVIEKSEESTASILEAVLQGVGVMFAAIFAGIICWYILSALAWIFYIVALAAFGVAAYFLYLIIKVILASKK